MTDGGDSKKTSHASLIRRGIYWLCAATVAATVFYFQISTPRKHSVVYDRRIVILKNIETATQRFIRQRGASPQSFEDLNGIEIMKGMEFTTRILSKEGKMEYQLYTKSDDGDSNAILARALVPTTEGKQYVVYLDGRIDLVESER